nr:MAG TPA: hypothetical protein [Caudoviricetes sp.]
MRFKRPCFLPFPHIQFPHLSPFAAILMGNKGTQSKTKTSE